MSIKLLLVLLSPQSLFNRHPHNDQPTRHRLLPYNITMNATSDNASTAHDVSAAHTVPVYPPPLAREAEEFIPVDYILKYHWSNAIVSGEKATVMAIVRLCSPKLMEDKTCASIFLRHFCMAGADALRRIVTSHHDVKLCAEIMVDRLKSSDFAHYLTKYAMVYDYTGRHEKVILPDSARLKELGKYDMQFPFPSTSNGKQHFPELHLSISGVLGTFLEGWRAVSKETLMLSMTLLNLLVHPAVHGDELCKVALGLACEIETDKEMRDALDSLICIISSVPKNCSQDALSVAVCRKLLFHGPPKISPKMARKDDKDVNDPPTWDWGRKEDIDEEKKVQENGGLLPTCFRRTEMEIKDCLPSELIDQVVKEVRGYSGPGRDPLCSNNPNINFPLILFLIRVQFPSLFRKTRSGKLITREDYKNYKIMCQACKLH